MNDHQLRQKYKNIERDYEDTAICAANYFLEQGWISDNVQVYSMEADPQMLECHTTDGNVLYIDYDAVNLLVEEYRKERPL